MAPEKIKGTYNEKSDIWSVGVIMYILLSGVPPFDGETDEEIMRKIKDGNYSLNLNSLKKISWQGIDILKKMLTYDYKKRVSAG